MQTILFVDDEPSIRSALKRMYVERDDLRCLFAASASEGLHILEHEHVCVVVADYLMPGMRGIEFLAHVKNRWPQIVRIMMTGCADINIAIDAINTSEAYRFVIKPWNDGALLNTVDEALMRYQLVESLATKDEAVYLSLAQTIELKDPCTKGHCDRVARYAVALAKAVKLDKRMLIDIKHGSWLHDCGKIGVPERILNFPGQLDSNDMASLMQHPRWGAEVARQARLSETVINIVLYHHERFDGTGYPYGLKGAEIPIEARIVAIADVFDALHSDRPYREAYDLDRALETIQEMTLSYFDPELIKPFFCLPKELVTDEH